MKFSFAATAMFALSLLGVTDAAHIEINLVTGPQLLPFSTTVLVGNDGKSNGFGADFLDGCKTKGYSWLKQICIDSKNRRAHVNYTSGLKRCFRRTTHTSKRCGGPETCYRGRCQQCTRSVYTEAKCNW